MRRQTHPIPGFVISSQMKDSAAVVLSGDLKTIRVICISFTEQHLCFKLQSSANVCACETLAARSAVSGHIDSEPQSHLEHIAVCAVFLCCTEHASLLASGIHHGYNMYLYLIYI